MRKLTPKQQLFVAEYLIDLNATQAAIRAGYSHRTAEWMGPRLVTKSHVAVAIQDAMGKRSEKVGIESEKVLHEILKLAMSDVRKLFDCQGRLLPVHMLPNDVAAAVSSIKVTTSRVPGTDPVAVEFTSEIKFWDKKGALELLGKHLKLFGNDSANATVINNNVVNITPEKLKAIAIEVAQDI